LSDLLPLLTLMKLGMLAEVEQRLPHAVAGVDAGAADGAMQDMKRRGAHFVTSADLLWEP
jgi:hypothetical protein